MNRIRLAMVLILLSALAVNGCKGKEGDTGKDVLVTVNGQPIKTVDLQIAWNALPVDQRKAYNSPKGIVGLLEELISYKLMAIEAQNRKLDEDPDFKKRMELYRERLLVNALLDQSMSDADLVNYFQRNFLRARFIRAAFPEKADAAVKAAARAKADQALAALAAPDADFLTVIETFSDLGPGESGEMGYVTHQTIENMTNFAGADALFNLKESGQHTGVIEGRDGWYIFELVEPPGKLDVRGLSKEMKIAIRDERREQVIRSQSSELKSRKEFVIERNQANLSTLLKSLEQNWADIGDADTAEPASGSTAAPAPGGTAAPAPGGTAAPPSTPAGGTAAAPVAPGATVPAAPSAPAPGATVPAAGSTPQAP